MGYSTAKASQVKDIVSKLVKQHFSATLGKEPDIVNIVNAQILYESSYLVDKPGRTVSTAKGTGGYAYINSSAVQNVLNTGTSTQVNNVLEGLNAWGLSQVMGWNIVKGGSPSGVCEIERLRPDLSSQLVVNPGESIRDKLSGQANIEKALLAGLIILEGKYKAVLPSGAFFQVKGDPYKRLFTTKMAGALGAYLGLGRSDLNKTTPEKYSAEILGGNTYARANGTNPIYTATASATVKSTNGPNTNGGDLSRVTIKGC